MNPLPILTRPVRRYLVERLERLHEALSGLACRLREGIAAVVAEHVGAAVREAVETALDRRPPAPAARYPAPDPYPYAGPYAGGSPGLDDPDPFWHDAPPAPAVPPREAPADRGPPRWWALLPAALRALSWLLRRGPARRPLLAVLGLAGLAGLAAAAAGPVAALAVAVAGTALTLAGLADGASALAGGLAGAPAR